MEDQDPEWNTDLKAKHQGLFRNIGPYNLEEGPGWQAFRTPKSDDPEEQ